MKCEKKAVHYEDMEDKTA